MEVSKIKEMVAGQEYDFLRTNEHLGGRILFLTLGGSHAYGLETPASDVDIRGCAMNSRSDILGLTSFEQVVDEKTDTTVYGFNKLIRLLIGCNPNTIEMLGCKPEHYIVQTDIGMQMVENRRMFLSRKAALHAFGGYATQQLRRLENAIARDRMAQARKEEHILNSMKRSVASFEGRYSSFENGSINLYTDVSQREELDREVFADIHIEHYPVRSFNSMMNDLTNVVGVYDKLNGRNRKKDEAHLDKHACHLIRLQLMCLDILEKGEVVTYRESDRDFLMDIRHGKYRNEDGTYRQEFFDMVTDFERRIVYASENTDLPNTPNMKLIEEFVMDVNRRSI